MAADGGAGMVIAVSHIATASGAIAWSTIDWIKFRKPSLVGTATGVIAGLATVTPASGYVGPGGGLIVSAVAGVAYFFGMDIVKERWKMTIPLMSLPSTESVVRWDC